MPTGDVARRLRRALDAAEAAARPPIAWVRRPLRHLRGPYDRLTGPHEVSCELFTGRSMTVVVPEIVGTQLHRNGFIEAQVTRVLIDHVRPGMVVFDVGAQYGYHSLVAAELVGPQGRVVAFEPGRNAFRLLTANVASVECVVAENMAVDGESGTVELRDFGVRNSALNTTRSMARVPTAERERLQGESYSVASTTIDDYVARTALVPDVVKIDVEGAELAVLRGMDRLLRMSSPLVTVEAGDYEGMDSPRTSESIDHLARLGYECFESADGTLRPHRRRDSYSYDNLFFAKPPSRA